MKITIIGSSYVSLVTGACLAELGSDVFCLDVDQKKIDLLNAGGVPVYEPGLRESIERNRAAGRIQFSTDVAASVAHGGVQFIAVGTPSDGDGSADLKYVLTAVRNIIQHMTGFKVIVDKLTVPVGTGGKVRAAVGDVLAMCDKSDIGFSAVSNPEFLKEGAAMDDFIRSDRIVFGICGDADGLRAKAIMHMLYAPFSHNHERTFYMDVRSAEFTECAANSMLTTRISFINKMANLADKVGADIEPVRLGIGSDPRISYSLLYAGTGYGGSCFPKDVQVLVRTAQEYSQTLYVLEVVEAVNDKQREVLVGEIEDRLGADLTGRIFTIWGLAFKPNTDGMREAPSRILIVALLARGARVQVYDPVTMEEARHALGLDLSAEQLEHVAFCAGQMDALKDADAPVIVTEWKAFRSPDFNAVKAPLKTPMVFGGRNLFEPQAMRDVGFGHQAIGRSTQS